MKNLIQVILVLVLIYCCTSSKQLVESGNVTDPEVKKDTIKIVNEELEYEILIIEIGFDSWLVTQRPMSYYSQWVMENRNNIYVIEWNQRVMDVNQYNSDLYWQTINYDSQIDYGLEVNYMLYMYFKFFEEKYNQNLALAF